MSTDIALNYFELLVIKDCVLKHGAIFPPILDIMFGGATSNHSEDAEEPQNATQILKYKVTTMALVPVSMIEKKEDVIQCCTLKPNPFP